jgi:hypothetical protein
MLPSKSIGRSRLIGRGDGVSVVPLISFTDLDKAAKKLLPPRQNVREVTSGAGYVEFEMPDGDVAAAIDAGYMFQGDMGQHLVLTKLGKEAYLVWMSKQPPVHSYWSSYSR